MWELSGSHKKFKNLIMDVMIVFMWLEEAILKGFGQASLFGARRGYMPAWLKTKKHSFNFSNIHFQVLPQKSRVLMLWIPSSTRILSEEVCTHLQVRANFLIKKLFPIFNRIL